MSDEKRPAETAEAAKAAKEAEISDNELDEVSGGTWSSGMKKPPSGYP